MDIILLNEREVLNLTLLEFIMDCFGIVLAAVNSLSAFIGCFITLQKNRDKLVMVRQLAFSFLKCKP